MIICKRLDPPDDHLQEAGSSVWSFAKDRILWMNNENANDNDDDNDNNNDIDDDNDNDNDNDKDNDKNNNKKNNKWEEILADGTGPIEGSTRGPHRPNKT